jgi:hypothetical protein
MQLRDRVEVLAQLGKQLKAGDEYLEALMHRTKYHNAWFTIDNQKQSVEAIADYYLSPARLDQWLAKYALPDNDHPKTVGIIMAGNIPLVGFHDWLCVFVAGHQAKIKLSDKDPYLLPHLLKMMTTIDERVASYYEFSTPLKDFEAVIATGSNNSARYFEAYFSKYPHIIRKNRNGVAVLKGTETEEELRALGKDVFNYFGLGCRNVSKLYVPEGYDFDPLLEALYEYRQIILNTKYKNNFDYNYALYILNKEVFKANGCILIREDEAIPSRIATLHYETYTDLETLESTLANKIDDIQCIVSQEGTLQNHTSFSFGQAQQPELWDYADGVDTMNFLLNL